MSSLATAVIGGAVIGAVSSNRAAKKQAGAITESTDASIASQERMFEQQREDFAPWRDAGVNALNMMQDPVNNFYASPDFNFRMTEGLGDLGNQFNLKGGGGNAMKGLEAFRNNLAGSEFGNWFNRIFGISEAGRGAQGTVAHAGVNAANAISGAHGAQGANMANVYGNKYANINNAFQSGLSNMLYMNQAEMGPWKT